VDQACYVVVDHADVQQRELFAIRNDSPIVSGPT
jgi:hypothetical protein